MGALREIYEYIKILFMTSPADRRLAKAVRPRPRLRIVK